MLSILMNMGNLWCLYGKKEIKVCDREVVFISIYLRCFIVSVCCGYIENFNY